MICYRNTADLRKALIDLQVPAIKRKKREPYGRRVIDQLKLRQPVIQVCIAQLLLRKRGSAGRRSASRADLLQLFRFVHLYSANKVKSNVHDN